MSRCQAYSGQVIVDQGFPEANRAAPGHSRELTCGAEGCHRRRRVCVLEWLSARQDQPLQNGHAWSRVVFVAEVVPEVTGGASMRCPGPPPRNARPFALSFGGHRLARLM